MTDDRWRSPLGTRYASPAMQILWGEPHRIGLWRRLWLALAEAERELGLDIPDEALAQMRAHLDDVDLAVAARYERRFRHDVMAHVHAFGDQAPAARPFLHLGATSAFVTDNADLIVMRDGLRLLLGRLVAVLQALEGFARRTAGVPCLAYTHFQPAQLTTVGKRATLWMQDLALDVEEIAHRLDDAPLPRLQGTTGTQASFLELFGGDHAKVRELERRVTAKLGFRDAVRRHRPDVPAEGRQHGARRAERHRAVGRQDGRRPAAAPARGRDARAVRVASRSARAPWPTSGTRCGPSGSPASRAS